MPSMYQGVPYIAFHSIYEVNLQHIYKDNNKQDDELSNLVFNGHIDELVLEEDRVVDSILYFSRLLIYVNRL